MAKILSRCSWASSDDATMRAYHDTEWGVPLHDDTRLFEFLVLEGAQAGLSWSTVLNKRDAYRRAFHGFDIARVARMMGMTPGQMLRWVTIPASVPALAVGMRNAWAFSWRSLLAGELLMATRGLGQVLMLGRELNDMAQVFAVMIVIAALGYAMDNGVFRRLEAMVASRWDTALR